MKRSYRPPLFPRADMTCTTPHRRARQVCSHLPWAEHRRHPHGCPSSCLLAELFEPRPDLPGLGGIGERMLGFFHLGTGLWLMYLMFAPVLNFTLHYTLPL